MNKTVHFYYRYDDPEKDKCDIYRDCICSNPNGTENMESHKRELERRNLTASLIDYKLHINNEYIDYNEPTNSTTDHMLYKQLIEYGHSPEFSAFSVSLHSYWDHNNTVSAEIYNTVKNSIMDLYHRIIYGLINNELLLPNPHFHIYKNKIICVETGQSYIYNKTTPVREELDKIYYNLFKSKIV